MVTSKVVPVTIALPKPYSNLPRKIALEERGKRSRCLSNHLAG